MRNQRRDRITTVETFPVPPRWLFVRIGTESGNVGWGEATLEGHVSAVQGCFEEISSRFIGVNAFQIEDIWQCFYRGGFYRGGPVLMSALSGLDQALWDLKGKAFEVPAWELLGGRVRDRIRAYAWIGGDRPDDISKAAKRRRQQGFQAVKMNATAESGYLEDAAFVSEVVSRVEAAQSEGLEVAIDFHGRVHRASLGYLCSALAPLHPLFIEEPVLPEHLENLGSITTNGIPVALGERLYSRWNFKSALHCGQVDIVQPDLSHAGGLSEVRRIAAMAEAYDVAVAPHCPLGPPALGACLQLAACTPNVVLQEMSLGIHYNTSADLLSYMKDPSIFDVVDGYVKIPVSPGLGVELDESKVRQAAITGHEWSNPLWRLADGSVSEW